MTKLIFEIVAYNVINNKRIVEKKCNNDDTQKMYIIAFLDVNLVNKI